MTWGILAVTIDGAPLPPGDHDQNLILAGRAAELYVCHSDGCTVMPMTARFQLTKSF